MSQSRRSRIRHQAGDRCGYCRSHQRYVWGPLEIEHILPKAKGGTDDEENLWLACSMCNTYKATQIEGLDEITGQLVPLFNPRRQKWSEHFRWNERGDQVVGITACGRVTVIALHLNNLLAVTVHRAWISAGWHPPTED